MRGHKKHASAYISILVLLGVISLEFKYIPLAVSNGYRIDDTKMNNLLDGHPLNSLTEDCIVEIKQPTIDEINSYHIALAKKHKEMEEAIEASNKAGMDDILTLFTSAADAGKAHAYRRAASRNNSMLKIMFNIYDKDADLREAILTGEESITNLIGFTADAFRAVKNLHSKMA